MQDTNGTPRIKVVRKTEHAHVVEVDELALDEIRIERLHDHSFGDPVVIVRAIELLNGKRTGEWQWARLKVTDMPADLRDKLLAWAGTTVREQAEAKVASVEAP